MFFEIRNLQKIFITTLETIILKRRSKSPYRENLGKKLLKIISYPKLFYISFMSIVNFILLPSSEKGHPNKGHLASDLFFITNSKVLKPYEMTDIS